MIDLSAFHGIVPERLTPSQLQNVRKRFAGTVTDFAAHCASNSELLNGLFAACTHESGLPIPKKIGEGSTRIVWSLPFGLVIKLERKGSLNAEEKAWRGDDPNYILGRRRSAHLGELISAIRWKGVLPRIYAAMLSFGKVPPNPGCIVLEKLTPLEDLLPGHYKGVSNDCLFVSNTTGELMIDDPRLPQLRKPRAGYRPLPSDLAPPEGGYWLGNLGVDAEGRAFILDAGNFSYTELDIDPKSLTPSGRFFGLVIPWERVDWGSLNRKPWVDQTARLSKALMTIYETGALSEGCCFPGIRKRTLCGLLGLEPNPKTA